MRFRRRKRIKDAIKKGFVWENETITKMLPKRVEIPVMGGIIIRRGESICLFILREMWDEVGEIEKDEVSRWVLFRGVGQLKRQGRPLQF